MAASPIGSGQSENALVIEPNATLRVNACRGSEAIVTGMPRRALSASFCTRLCHSAVCRDEAMRATLKWVMRRFSSISLMLSRPVIPGPVNVASSGLTGAKVWNISPAFSSSVICASRSATRSSMGDARVFVGIETAVLVEIAESYASIVLGHV